MANTRRTPGSQNPTSPGQVGPNAQQKQAQEIGKLQKAYDTVVQTLGNECAEAESVKAKLVEAKELAKRSVPISEKRKQVAMALAKVEKDIDKAHEEYAKAEADALVCHERAMAADKRIAEIKEKGTQLRKEKEQLQKDLANYCLSQAGVTALPIPVQEIAELPIELQRQAMQCFEALDGIFKAAKLLKEQTEGQSQQPAMVSRAGAALLVEQMQQAADGGLQVQGFRQGDRITLPNGTQLEVSEGAGLQKAVAEAASQAWIKEVAGAEGEGEEGDYENWDLFGDAAEVDEASMEGGRENDGDGFRVYAKRGATTATKKEERDRSRSGSPSLEEQQEARRKVVASASKGGGRGRGTPAAASHRGPDAGQTQG
jgi:hypothetical protein